MADVYNETDNTIVTGTAGDDSIKNEGSPVTINSNSGNDYILNDFRKDYVIIH